MLHRIVASTIATVLLLSAGFSNDPPSALVRAEESEAAKSPVDNWGNWWPKSQFGEDSTLTQNEVNGASRRFKSISLGSVKSPWGWFSVSLTPLENESGLSLSIGLDGPPSTATKEELAKVTPNSGEVKISIVREGEVKQYPKEGDPVFRGWVWQSEAMAQGGCSASFGWLPADFEDYWIRFDCKDERSWVLIPYGLCSDPKAELPAKVARKAPTRPKGVGPKDMVRSWESVEYELGARGPGNRHIRARVCNPFDASLRLSLYRENERWNLATPRTNATYLWPGGYTRFSSLMRLSRDLSYERTDEFEFWTTPQDIATWGLLRVTLEEERFDVAVPSSLFHYTHGHVPEK